MNKLAQAILGVVGFAIAIRIAANILEPLIPGLVVIGVLVLIASRVVGGGGRYRSRRDDWL